MIIDKPKLSKATRDLIRKAKNNMKLDESETSQLAVFDELIQDSIIPVIQTNIVKRKKRDENKLVVRDELGNEIWEDHIIERVIFKKDVVEYNQFRKRKKQFVKELQKKAFGS